MADNSTLPGGDIHRLLDQAFAAIEMTPDAQDLKEEVRANLVARVAELEGEGRTSGDAARRAISELGDVRALLGETPDSSTATRGTGAAYLAELRRHRVRPKPAFVARIVLAASIAAVALTLAVLGAADALPLPIGTIVGMLGLAATAIGWIVGDSLARETTTNHPMPNGRAGGFFLASSLVTFGLGVIVLVVLTLLPMWWIVFGAVGMVAAIALYSYLGVTQTNRRKAWVLALHEDQYANVGTRFEDEPETAARFGIYTVVIWIIAIAAFVVLIFAGWAWSWLALVAGLVAMMLVLARMLFGVRKA